MISIIYFKPQIAFIKDQSTNNHNIQQTSLNFREGVKKISLADIPLPPYIKTRFLADTDFFFRFAYKLKRYFWKNSKYNEIPAPSPTSYGLLGL